MHDAVILKNLKKNYPKEKVAALKGIDLKIKQGEFFGLLGPNGAGKTTTINIMSSLCNKSAGEVKIAGFDLIEEYQAARGSIGLVPQEFNFDQFVKLRDMLIFQAGFFGIPRKEAERRIEKILKDLGIWEKRNAQLRQLSGGMKRRAMIARALMHKPKILILDEPTAGVDVELRRTLWKYLRKINKQGTTILLTTHYIEEAEELCDRVAIINNGRIIALDTVDKLLDNLQSEQIILRSHKTITKAQLALLKKFSPEIKNGGDAVALTFNKHDDYEALLKKIISAKIPIKDIATTQNKLEDVFIQLTEGDHNA